ncbi:MAG: hypothetical protein JZU47_09930 [Prolixibacteraceae bacterium]|nr:hypothetical protein [Prolixibacteraceae bacterium]
MLNDRRLSALIDALWREYPGLINEKYDRDPDKWLLNCFNSLIDFGVAIGIENSINGNQSTDVGTGLISQAFRELVLGSYNDLATHDDPEKWILTDRLLTIGNGPDKYSRRDALLLFKSGFLKLFNAVRLSAYQHGTEIPENGILQYLEKRVEISFDGAWHELALKKDCTHTERIIIQNDHGFCVGTPIKPALSVWIKTKADQVSNAGTVAFVSEIIDADTFRYIEHGPLPGMYIPDEVYFLSTTVAGELMTQSDPEVWRVGQVREVLGTANPEGTALVVKIEEGEEIVENVFDDKYVTQLLYNLETRTLTLKRSAGLPDLSIAIPLGISLSQVAFTGEYNHLINKPTLTTSFLQLIDVLEDTYAGKSKAVPMVTEEEDGLELMESEELLTEIARTTLLADMPQSLAGFAGYSLRVKQDESGFEFYMQ